MHVLEFETLYNMFQMYSFIRVSNFRGVVLNLYNMICPKSDTYCIIISLDLLLFMLYLWFCIMLIQSINFIHTLTNQHQLGR